jgi:YkoY family integral membrane protein
MLNQSFELHDLAVLALLVVLEGVLSIDNALVLGLIARRLPKQLQGNALTYGLIGAFIFRFIAIALAAYLLHWQIVKLVGGLYLVYISLKHFFFEAKETSPDKLSATPQGDVMLTARDGSELSAERTDVEIEERSPVPATGSIMRTGFWSTVAVLALTDIAFAMDSILAAIGVVGARPRKLWLVIGGGLLGIIVLRFAAVMFIKLLEKFPRLEVSAYLLVIVIGAKLIADWGFNRPPAGMSSADLANFHGALDFHSYHSPAFWAFWGSMAACFAAGFLPPRGTPIPGGAGPSPGR